MSWGGHAAEMQLLQTEDRSTIPRGNPDIGMRYVSGEKNLRAIFVKMIESELKKDQIEQSLSQKENTAQSQTFSQTFWTDLTQKRFEICHHAQYNPDKTLDLTRRLLFVNHHLEKAVWIYPYRSKIVTILFGTIQKRLFC